MKNRPRLGTGIVLIQDNKILLGERINSHGANHWGMPGGNLEFNEVPEHGAIREVLEETGIKLGTVKFWTITNDVFIDEELHYITLWYYANIKDKVPELKEPDKCKEWKWFSWDRLPQNLFLSDQNLRNQEIKLPTQ